VPRLGQQDADAGRDNPLAPFVAETRQSGRWFLKQTLDGGNAISDVWGILLVSKEGVP